MKPVEIISTPEDVLRISFMVSNTCNYTCSYCFPGSNAGTKPYVKNWHRTANNFKSLFDYYLSNTNKKKFSLEITGGEPTLWPDLQLFCKEIQTHYNVMISLQSNGSRTLRWWNENSQLFSKVLLSYHIQESNITSFIEVADTCYANDTFVVATVCMDPNSWDQCLNAIDSMKNSKYRWYIRLQKLENIEYTPDQMSFLMKPIIRLPNLWYAWKHRSKFYNKESKGKFLNGSVKTLSQHEISLNKWNHFYNWECNLGVDSLFITPDGVITGTCNQILFNEKKNYNIFDPDFSNNFNPTIKPLTCKSIGCYCVPEINLSKRSIPILPL